LFILDSNLTLERRADISLLYYNQKRILLTHSKKKKKKKHFTPKTLKKRNKRKLLLKFLEPVSKSFQKSHSVCFTDEANSKIQP
jgi:hypothetical protein